MPSASSANQVEAFVFQSIKIGGTDNAQGWSRKGRKWVFRLSNNNPQHLIFNKGVAMNLKHVFAGLVLAAAVSTPAHAVITYQTGTNTISIPGLTGFATTGAMMDGLAVTAEFNDLSETLFWADTGPNSGGVFGNGWSLTLDGDTFGASWIFDFEDNAGLGQLLSLTLDGIDALTVFDRTFNNVEGTPGSANGRDWVCLSGACNDATVTYDYLVSIGAAAAVGDLFQTVNIDFGDLGPRDDFSFGQDTDNDSRLITDVPEPAGLLLLGGALAALGIARRRS
jgi:hypothetical protein